MKRIGIAGLQDFDAGLDAPLIVDKRIVYMSPEWKNLFHFAVARADALGLDYGIASSPGWSETGGPWVTPEDGMKKLTWSTTSIVGERRFDGALTQPSSIAGPFQTIRRPSEQQFDAPRFYRDALVFAYNQPAALPIAEPTVTVNAASVQTTILSHGDYATGISLPTGSGKTPGFVEMDYDCAQTVRSLNLYVSNIPGFSIAGPLTPRLEASDDGTT